jgi:FAD dependent oxidoreductase TIGR03364
MKQEFDVVVVGQGVVGLAHAYAAARAGMSVAVVDRHERALGASIRNFGFVTVTGQARREMWSLAMRARDIWAGVAPQAKIDVVQTGLNVFAHRREAAEVLADFLETEMGEHCHLTSAKAWRDANPHLDVSPFEAVLQSPHELRLEARDAIPLLRSWLERAQGVRFLDPADVVGCDAGRVETTRGVLSAGAVFICPGDDLNGLFPDVMARRQVTRCKLHMLRLAPPGVKLPAPVMADLSLIRYEGYAELPSAAALRRRIEAERGDMLAAGIHLIAVQSADGSLVVGDTHEYGDSPSPFQPADKDELMLAALRDTLPGLPAQPVERWIGVYASSPQGPWFSEEVRPGVHMTLITCGAGMSTAFAIAEQVVSRALNVTLAEAA